MQNNDKITYICTELGLDPTDPSSRKTIERLVEAKPDLPVNDQFIAMLREDIQSKASTFVPQEWNSQQNPVKNLISSFMNKILASALVVMVVLAAGGLWYIQNRTDQPLFQTSGSNDAGQLLSDEYAITGVAEESFGNLDKVSIVNKSTDVGTGGGNKAAVTIPNMQGQPSDTEMVEDSTRIMPPDDEYVPTEYTFKYAGGELPSLANKQSVLKRILPKQSTTLIDRIVGLLSFGLIDLGRFNNVIIQNLSFVEDKPNGYYVNVDLTNGSVNLNLDWSRWTQMNDNNCLINVCPELAPLKESDIPPNNEVFAVTDKFLAEYGISTQAYGRPVVQDSQWRIMYDQLPAAEKAGFYIPEQVQVVYPLMLENQQVFDESGFVSGLTLTYDIRTKQVVSLYDLTTKKFEKSSYVGVTDQQKVLEVARLGGFRNYTYESTEPNVRKVELQLGTPTVKWVKMWYMDPKQTSATYPAMGGDLYVPSLVFPIQDWEKQGYWRSSVIVPLVKDILESEYIPEPIPVPMPIDPGIGDGSSSSASGSAGATEPAVLPSTRN